MSRHQSPRRDAVGFTLIELLVVIAIVAILGGMMAYSFARPEVRRESVRLAAEELAATLRQARVMAMERKAAHGVVFHIQNAPGSSGIVLNNRSGGHWYRILGPNTLKGTTDYKYFGDLPPAKGASKGPPRNLKQVEELVSEAWVDEAHVLPAGQVRFLALSDMDFGTMRQINKPQYRRHVTGENHASYPRPWFGWYDEATKRLYPWGGYDPAITGSGFYYWGLTHGTQGTRDPEPVGSMHPVDRSLANWVQGGRLPNDVVLYEAGTPRPVIDAHWQDARIVFLSSGEAQWGGWLPARRSEHLRDETGNRRGAFDRSNGRHGGAHFNERTHTEADNFEQATGGWFITLAPDVRTDNDRFDTAEAAMASIAPMYRVFVSRMGEVRVIPVRRTQDFGSATLVPSSAAWWQSNSNLENFFPRNRYIESGIPVGEAITNVVTPQMLRERQVWKK